MNCEKLLICYACCDTQISIFLKQNYFFIRIEAEDKNAERALNCKMHASQFYFLYGARGNRKQFWEMMKRQPKCNLFGEWVTISRSDSLNSRCFTTAILIPMRPLQMRLTPMPVSYTSRRQSNPATVAR